MSAPSRPLRAAKTTKCEHSTGWVWPFAAAESLSRMAGSVTTTNLHGCMPKEDGARTRASSRHAQVAAGIFLVRSNLLVA
jgi:hypothetical protein